MRFRSYSWTDSKIWVIIMTSSMDDLTKLLKKHLPAFTQFSYSIFVQTSMHSQEQVKWRPATWGLVSEVYQIVRKCPYDFIFVQLSQKTLGFFCIFFWLRLFEIKFLIQVQWDFTWSNVVWGNQLIKKNNSGFFLSWKFF